MDNQTLESMLVCTTKPQQVLDQKKPKPQTEQALKCPRCDSSNTKFCYYNNYSLTQPRYFCKSCRRYWTQGGTLRNVPVGGGCRKNKRSSSSSSSSISNSSSSISTSKIIRTQIEKQLDHHHRLALAKFQKETNGGQMGFDDQDQIFDHTHMGIHLGNQINESSPMDFNHLYFNGEMGYNNNNNNVGAMGLNMGGQEMIPFEELSGHENNNRSVLWGFPWQFGDGNNMSMGLMDIDPRGNWINGIGSSWHGLLNSPLM